MFSTRKDLEARLEAATADLEQAEAQLNAANEKAEEAAANAQRISELEAELEAEKEAHTATQTALESEQAKTSDEAIQALVTEELAKAGHEPVEEVEDIEPDADAKAEELYSEYRTLQKEDPRKATAFWNEHKDTLTGLA